MDTTLILYPQTVVRRAREVLFSQLDDELLAIDANAGYCYSLTGPAGKIWELIAAPITLDDLCAALRRRYAVDEQTCLADVSELLLDLRRAGLVEVENATA